MGLGCRNIRLIRKGFDKRGIIMLQYTGFEGASVSRIHSQFLWDVGGGKYVWPGILECL